MNVKPALYAFAAASMIASSANAAQPCTKDGQWRNGSNVNVHFRAKATSDGWSYRYGGDSAVSVPQDKFKKLDTRNVGQFTDGAEITLSNGGTDYKLTVTIKRQNTRPIIQRLDHTRHMR